MPVFNSLPATLWSAGIDYLNDNIRCALFSSLWSPDQQNDEFFADLSGEATGSGYTAGGVLLTGKTITAGSNSQVLDAANPEWLNVTSSDIAGCVFYKDTGSAATSPLISFTDFGAVYAPAGQTVRVVIHPSGLIGAQIVLV